MIPLNLREALSAKEQLIDFETALALGVTYSEIQALIRSGALVRIRRGVYTTGEHWSALTTPPQRELLRARAASMCIGPDHVLSHDSAAHALSMPFLMPRRPYVHVTRPPVKGSRHETGVKHHTAGYRPGQVVEVGGLRVLDHARTAVDLARQYGVVVGASACDSALRLGSTVRKLERAVAPMAYWRGVNSARAAVAWADAGAENPGESKARMLVIEAGFGRPITQFPVDLGDHVAWCDMLIATHVIEFDGRVKYRRREDGGVATRDPSEVAWNERRRERALIEAGLGVSRLIWDDLLPQNWDRSRARLMSEISQSIRRTGLTTPAHLLEFAQMMQNERTRRVYGA